MKIIVTGSLGHISKPLATTLVQKGHSVTVVSSNPGKQADIETLGATAAIGALEDIVFLTDTFTGADAAYCMIPPGNYFDYNLDLRTYCHHIGNNYAQAIRDSGVKRVVFLSSIGAHLEKGSGSILYYHEIEGMLNNLPGIAVTHMRPTSFYYNLYGYANRIKSEGIIAANYGAEDKIPWVAPADIAAAIAQEIVTPLAGSKVRYVASEELTGNETAAILGMAIGKPDLKWMVITNEAAQRGLEAAGMPPSIAAGLIEMYASLHSGALAADYYRNQPAVMGQVKMTDFAQEFSTFFKQN